MSNIPLGSLKFPGLNDKFTVPRNAGELPYDPDEEYPEGSAGAQISENTNDISSQSQQIANLQQSKASKGSVATVAARVDNITDFLKAERDYGFTDGQSPAYVQPVAAGAYSMADVRMIGAKSRVVNNAFIANLSTWTKSRCTSETSDGVTVFTAATGESPKYLSRSTDVFTKGHKYYIAFDWKKLIESISSLHVRTNSSNDSISLMIAESSEVNVWSHASEICTIPADTTESLARFTFRCTISESSADLFAIKDKSIRCVDLTKWFGSGNEPSVTNDPKIDEVLSYLDAHPNFVGSEIVSAQTAQIASHSKNLFNGTDILSGYIAGPNTSSIVYSTSHRSVWCRCKPNTTYTVSKTGGLRLMFAWTKERPASGVETYGGKGYAAETMANTYTLTTGDDAKYLIAWVDIYAASRTPGVIASVQIEESPSATPFSPYGIKGQLDIPAGLRTFFAQHGYGMSAGDLFNSINLVEQFYLRKIFSYTFTGSETWITSLNRAYIRKADLISYGATPARTMAGNDYFKCRFISDTNYDQYSYKDLDTNTGIGMTYDDGGPVRSADIQASELTGKTFVYESNESDYQWFYDPKSPLLAANGGTITPDYTMTSATDTIPSTAHHIVLWEHLFPDYSHIQVERGGTVTFEQTGGTEIPIPNQVRYAVKLADTL